MPYDCSYNQNIAHTIHQINQRKVDFENLNNDNIEGSGKIALKTHLDTGFGPTLDLPVSGSGMSAGRKRQPRKKGGDLGDVIDTVGKVASIAAPFVMGLGKKKAPRKKGGIILGLQAPYKSGESDIPPAPTPITAVSASQKLVINKPTTRADAPSGSSFGGGMSAGGISAGAKQKRPVSRKMKNRNELIKKLTKEKGMNLPQASKHIKEAKLTY